METRKKNREECTDPEKEKWVVKMGLVALGIFFVVFVALLGQWLNS